MPGHHVTSVLQQQTASKLLPYLSRPSMLSTNVHEYHPSVSAGNPCDLGLQPLALHTSLANAAMSGHLFTLQKC